MTKGKKIFRPNYNHSESDKLAIKTVQVYYNIVEQLQDGHAPDNETAEIIIQAFEQLAVEMSRIPKIQIETLPFSRVSPYFRERGDYLSQAFKPLFKYSSDEKEQIAFKIKEIITVVRLFNSYVFYAHTENLNEASKLTTEFIKDLASWYRDLAGHKTSKSSIYEYLKSNTLGINIIKNDSSEEDFKQEIILSKDTLDSFFTNNEVNKFPDKFKNLKNIVINFHSYIQQVLADY